MEGTIKDWKDRVEEEGGILVGGIVAVRDGMPYVHLDASQKQNQLTPAEAREVAASLLRAAAEAEADASVVGFLIDKLHQTNEGAARILSDLREFRRRNEEEQGEPDTTTVLVMEEGGPGGSEKNDE